MAWYDSITTTIGNAWDSTIDYANDAISAKAEQSKEEYRDGLKEPQPAPEGVRTSVMPANIDWQKWGVIAAAVGAVITLYSVVKK